MAVNLSEFEEIPDFLKRKKAERQAVDAEALMYETIEMPDLATVNDKGALFLDPDDWEIEEVTPVWHASLVYLRSTLTDTKLHRFVLRGPGDLAKQFYTRELHHIWNKLLKVPTPPPQESRAKLAERLWPLLNQVAVRSTDEVTLRQTKSQSSTPKTTDRFKVHDTTMFRATGKRPGGENKLPKQAAQIVELMLDNRTYKDKGETIVYHVMTMNDITTEMKKVVQTKQPISRIFKYYKAQLIRGGYIECVGS